MKKFMLGVCLSLSVCMIQASTISPVYAATEAKQESETDYEYYEGKVTSKVNVRKGAGADKAKVTVDGKGVALQPGTIVTIMGTKNVGDKPWYKIKFTYGKEEVTGYATSSYIEKTGNVITPIPTPEPTIEPTVKPTITEEPTMEPVATPVPEEKTESASDKTSKSKTLIYVAVVIILGGGIAGVYYFFSKKKKESGDAEHVSEKVAKLKDMVIGNDQETAHKKHDHNHGEVKKKPEVRVSKRDQVLTRSELMHENKVYVTKSANEEVAAAIELDEEEMINQSAEKKALRTAIGQLREHDIIIHKFFGRGEVFDNSDVKLIEVRFGQDVRFLNKNQLASKKLIEITNEHNR